ncbi:unnamed protein product [Blepharisma stoltei]|uniref:Uncharacterized protein n=1 Tax=Blepharisma stoltei TaxID=1481888 RepID=A0AAU9J611_9CILI|nr:unnamed protein product [Blepharisma stoltei]
MSFLVSRKDHHRSGVKKEVKRFLGEKKAGTGIDPKGTFIEFLKKDVKQNLDVHRDTVKSVENLDSRSNLPALGCTKKYRSVAAESREPVPYRLETDHISFRATDSKTGFIQAGNSIMGKPNHTVPNPVDKGWSPTVHKVSMRNCQSTPYDIINFEENPNAVVRKAINIDARREKGITEFSDLTRPLHSGVNKEHSEAIEKDQRVFFRKTGIFTHIYDAAARLGNITMPFDKHQDLGGRPAFKC